MGLVEGDRLLLVALPAGRADGDSVPTPAGPALSTGIEDGIAVGVASMVTSPCRIDTVGVELPERDPGIGDTVRLAVSPFDGVNDLAGVIDLVGVGDGVGMS